MIIHRPANELISQRCNRDEMSKNQSFLSTVKAGTPDHLPDIEFSKLKMIFIVLLKSYLRGKKQDVTQYEFSSAHFREVSGLDTEALEIQYWKQMLSNRLCKTCPWCSFLFCTALYKSYTVSNNICDIDISLCFDDNTP